MPEAKKNTQPKPRNYNSPLDSQIGGVRLTTAQKAQPDGQPEERQPGTVQTPDLVSKLIDFIKKI